MNDFYYEIDEAIDTIDELMNDEAENIENRIRKLTDQLTILEYMLSRVKAYMSDRGAVPTDIKDLNSIIIYGTTYEGHHIPPFAQNNRINEQEKAFLQEIRNFLLTTSDRLGTDEKKKINPAISFTEFQDIISENIYGEFIYRKFLDVYIDAGSD